jgi:hypothetical protein
VFIAILLQGAAITATVDPRSRIARGRCIATMNPGPVIWCDQYHITQSLLLKMHLIILVFYVQMVETPNGTVLTDKIIGSTWSSCSMSALIMYGSERPGLLRCARYAAENRSIGISPPIGTVGKARRRSHIQRGAATGGRSRPATIKVQ